MSTFSWRVLRLPLLITLLWGLLLFTLFRWTAQREDEYTTGLARIQTATLFSSIVDTRDWNANNGGVWVREHPGCPANPWLPEEERTLRAEGGATLVKVNPAYMTRQIAESFTSTMASFRISSLSPKRPENRADQWETGALLSFEKDRHELFDLISDKEGMRYRYMAALPAKESCIQCHQDKKVGDVLGGISVSISAEPLFAAATERKRTTGLAFGIIGIIGMVGIGGATFQINRKKELAEAANRTKSAFLANMTHDMRTPLTGILGMTELLERETQDSRHRYLLANLRKATDSLLTVVDGIMHYSLLEADRQPTCCAPFSLRAELGACIAVLRPACASRDIRLSLVTDDTVPDRLVGDGFRLRQALGNLLGNAVKFTEKGSVTLRVTRAESQAPEGRCALSFQVIDTGRGIPTDEQERIFESFEQGSGVRDSGDQHETGVGLGLAIARNIARRFGGDLTLSSTPGMGSVFTFTALFRLAADSDGLPETPASPCPASPSPLAQPDRPAHFNARGAPALHGDASLQPTAGFVEGEDVRAVRKAPRQIPRQRDRARAAAALPHARIGRGHIDQRGHPPALNEEHALRILPRHGGQHALGQLRRRRFIQQQRVVDALHAHQRNIPPVRTEPVQRAGQGHLRVSAAARRLDLHRNGVSRPADGDGEPRFAPPAHPSGVTGKRARRVAAKLAAHHAQARKFARQGILLRKADLFKALRTARHHSGGDGGARLRRDGRKDDGGQVSGRVCGNIADDHGATPPML